MEMIQAVIAAGEELNSPLILQTSVSTIRYASGEIFAAIVNAAAKRSKIPVALHLDHGNSLQFAEELIKSGYSSIMIDGSHLPLEENIAFTKKAAEFCIKAAIPLEGELGRVGGKEDDIVSDDSVYTDPVEAVRFVEETGISSLAIGVGTAHGVYKVTPVLKPDLISILREKLPVPLVLHGASGLEDAVVKDCISRGISKVNIATDLRIAYTQAVGEYLKQDPDCIDPKKFGEAAKEAVKKVAMSRIMVCGCQDRANDSL